MQKSGSHKRLQQELGQIARDTANLLVDNLIQNVEQMENWKRLQQAIDQLLLRYAETEIQRRMLY